MLGQLLEFSIGARPLAAAFEFYRSLGFQTAPVGDFVSGPSAAFFDGNIAIGLHERPIDGPVPTFVRPHLKDYVRGIRRRLGIELEYAHLAEDEFHEVGFCDPNGQLVRLIEARTFSPGIWDERNVCACGEFLEFSIATASTGHSQAFWEALGFHAIAGGDSPHPWLRLSGHGLILGLHQTARFPPGLSFRSPNLGARIEYLQAKGLEPKRGGPLAQGELRSATLIAPEGTALYLIEAELIEAEP